MSELGSTAESQEVWGEGVDVGGLWVDGMHWVYFLGHLGSITVSH